MGVNWPGRCCQLSLFGDALVGEIWPKFRVKAAPLSGQARWVSARRLSNACKLRGD